MTGTEASTENYEAYLEERFGKDSAMKPQRPVHHVTFDYATYRSVTIPTHSILETHVHLPPEGNQHIGLIHAAGTVQIIGEGLQTLATIIRDLQTARIGLGQHEKGGTIQQIIINGGQGNPFT
jgi:hypothetical protein